MVYPKYYKKRMDRIKGEVEKRLGDENHQKLFSQFEKTFEKLIKVPTSAEQNFIAFPGYLGVIRNLQYLRRWNRVNRKIETTVLGHTYLVALLALMFSRMHKKDKKVAQIEFEEKALNIALFHDVPESFTADVITPVKNMIESELSKQEITWKEVEEKLAHEPISKLLHGNTKLKEFIGLGKKKGLLSELDDSEKGEPASLVKDCDRMALVFECIFEKRAGNLVGEMKNAYPNVIEELHNSEWRHIREFAGRIVARYPVD